MMDKTRVSIKRNRQNVDHTTQIEEKENKKWNTTQHRQIKDGQHGLHQHIGVNPGTRLGYAVSYHFVTIHHSTSVRNILTQNYEGGQEEFEDTKGAIIIRISKKNRQSNGQKKKYKMTNIDQQNIHIKLKIG